MGFWANILSGFQPVRALSPNVTYLGSNDEFADFFSPNGVSNATVSELWCSQPHLRTVVSFLARNTAQLGLHTFERVGETDRRRDRKSNTARALSFPDVNMTSYDLVYALVGDLMLYDRAYWYVGPSTATRSGLMLRRLPPSWVSPVRGDAFTNASYDVTRNGQTVNTPASQILDFTGYSPTNPLKGSPTVDSLRDTLREQVEAAKYRGQVWKRGGRVSAVLQRPEGAPEWSEAAREAFREDWYAKYTGNGSRAGGTPILEDGMTLQRIDFNAQEQQFVEAAKLSLVTVAAAFHVNPTMIGQNDGANYSNVREFRRMLYGDTLGPLLAQVEARVNTFLIPMLGDDPDRFYCEFNIAEKLEGSFDEQSSALQTATGGPWMTRSEARARMNLPAIDGADELIVPLNVLLGGQASPQDSGSQNRRSGPVRRKARPENHETKHEQVMKAFFARQRRVVKSQLGSKDDEDWWDPERWDKELTDTLVRLYLLTSRSAAQMVLEDSGLDDYDVDRTMAFLDEAAKRSAKSINAATHSQISDALASDDPSAGVDGVFDVAEGSRSTEIAASGVTFASAFGSLEAARQNSDRATKTWVVTSGNPRPSHAALNGETVPVSENFSNGMAWPGDASGGADEVAGCSCEMDVNIR
jgi:HK97 family phage portal protein